MSNWYRSHFNGIISESIENNLEQSSYKLAKENLPRMLLAHTGNDCFKLGIKKNFRSINDLETFLCKPSHYKYDPDVNITLSSEKTFDAACEFSVEVSMDSLNCFIIAPLNRYEYI